LVVATTVEPIVYEYDPIARTKQVAWRTIAHVALFRRLSPSPILG